MTMWGKPAFSLGLALFALALAGCGDRVTISNSAGDQHGLLIDGDTAVGPDNDQGFVSAGTTIRVGRIRQRASTNEVVAFTNRRPVAYRNVADWGSGNVTVNVPLNNEIAIPVTVWIVKGPYLTQRQKAIDAGLTTLAIWRSERMGVRFLAYDIMDATGDSDAPTYHAFNCSKRSGIEANIGKTSGRINIYYVDTVDGGTGRGQACQIGSDFVAMGRNTGDELLSHELGHDFALTHIDDLTANFDQTNIMHPASSTREFATEGQVYRAHFDPNSALNFLYNARPGEPTRNCPRNTVSDTCPRIERRLWSDGTFPPN